MTQQLPVVVEEVIDRIRRDNTSGAHALTISACDMLGQVVQELPQDIPGEEFILLMARIGRQIVKAQPSIAPLRHMILQLVKKLEESSRGVSLHDVALSFIETYHDRLIEVKFRISAHAAPILVAKKNVMTHSFSTLVVEAFRQAKLNGGVFQVVVTESRPVMEGRLLSQHLAHLGIPVRVIVDAAAVSTLEQCDLVLLGADRLTEVDFINKIGSLAIVLSARELKIPIYVLTGSDKFLSQQVEPVVLTSHSGAEVWESAPKGVAIENQYFERIPLRLVTGIISENGITSYGQYAKKEGPFFDLAL